MKKTLAIALFGICLLLTAAAVSAADIQQITIGTTAAIERAVIGEYNYEMLSSGTTHIPLVRQDTNGVFYPQVADWSTEDGITWTYTITDGMKWQDGVDVTAADILFTLMYEDNSGAANLIDQTAEDGKVTGAKYSAYELSEDGRSISLTLAAPNVRELGNMTSFRLVPKHIYEGKEELSEEELRFGYGPYVFEEFNKNAGTISFIPNEYYPGTVHAGRLVYQLFDTPDTMYMALEAGDIDMVWIYSTGVAAAYQDVLGASENVQLISVDAGNNPAVLAFNNARGPFADENVRLAVTYALDYTTFRDYVGSALANIPNSGFAPAPTIGYKVTEALGQDLEKAEAYLEKAGYTRNSEGIFTNANGETPGFTLTFRADRENQLSCAEIIKTQLDSFGIPVVTEGLDADSYNAKTSNKFSENNITMEAALYGYTSAGMGMGNGLGSIYVDGNHAVQGGAQVFDEAFGDILKKMSAAPTPDEYITAAGELQDYYSAHRPVIALYWDCLTYGTAARFENLVIDNAFGLNNAQNWLSVTEK